MLSYLLHRCGNSLSTAQVEPHSFLLPLGLEASRLFRNWEGRYQVMCCSNHLGKNLRSTAQGAMP